MSSFENHVDPFDFLMDQQNAVERECVSVGGIFLLRSLYENPVFEAYLETPVIVTLTHDLSDGTLAIGGIVHVDKMTRVNELHYMKDDNTLSTKGYFSWGYLLDPDFDDELKEWMKTKAFCGRERQ